MSHLGSVHASDTVVINPMSVHCLRDFQNIFSLFFSSFKLDIFYIQLVATRLGIAEWLWIIFLSHHRRWQIAQVLAHSVCELPCFSLHTKGKQPHFLISVLISWSQSIRGWCWSSWASGVWLPIIGTIINFNKYHFYQHVIKKEKKKNQKKNNNNIYSLIFHSIDLKSQQKSWTSKQPSQIHITKITNKYWFNSQHI